MPHACTRRPGIAIVIMKWMATVFLFLPLVAARGADSLKVTAVYTNTPPRIDGMLRDPEWQAAIPIDRFVQRDPDEFASPTQKTEVRVLYDERSLYVGARMYDSAPDSIVGCLVRRDYGIDSDGFWVDLDPCHDHRSGYYFALDPTGSFYDGILYNDSWEDNTWDGVWDGATSRDSLGWCAEFRIPFSQLRFQQQDSMVWGINFWRWLTRRHETSYLTFAPRNESGFVSRFAHLNGMQGVPAPRYIEILPYGRGKGHFRITDKNDPFAGNAEFDATAGVDVKASLGPNLALNATANPDFGQVEVDPAVVNLSDVETYFDEKRPFFIEGSRNFDFGIGGASTQLNFNWPSTNYFYSRRIGRTPQGRLPLYDYADLPEGTRILGAGKVTGALGGNWNIGSVHALTSREIAQIDLDGQQSDVTLEPATYYTVNRVQKEMQSGFRAIGGILTAAHRQFDDDLLKDQINSDALTGGVDGWTFLDSDRTYVISGWSGFSHVRGTEARMIALQRSPAHYFQRPDAEQVSVDSQATSLTGFAGRIRLNKERGNWTLNAALGAVDPRFDLNDTGFLSRSNTLNAHTAYGYRWTRPTSWTRYASVRATVAGSEDYDGNLTSLQTQVTSAVNLSNMYGFGGTIVVNPAETVNTTRTRGGPLTKEPPSWSAYAWVSSDQRKSVELTVESQYVRQAADNWWFNPMLTARWKPASNLNVTLGPTVLWQKDAVQWVGAFPDPAAEITYGNRYVFAHLDYREVGASLRMNWTFTPRLSAQLFAQPLFSAAEYRHFKQLSRPNTYEFGRFAEEDILVEDGIYQIDPDGSGPAAPFAFYNPDFSLRSLRANFVVRWEYLPGSSVYVVWTHGRNDYEMNGEFDFQRSLDRLADASPDDILMFKASYWFTI